MRDDDVGQVGVDVVVGEVDLLEDPHLLDDFRHSLDGDAAAESAVAQVEKRFLAVEFDELRGERTTSMRLGGML